MPLALIDKRPGVTVGGMLRNWTLVFLGNFAGALTVAVMMAVIFTFAFTVDPNDVGQAIGHIGEGRTVGYAEHGGRWDIRDPDGQVPRDYWLVDPRDGSVLQTGRLPRGGGVVDDDSTDPRVLICSTVPPPLDGADGA